MPRRMALMIGRVALVFAVMSALVYGFPAFWVRLLAPVTRVMTTWTFPYVDDLVMGADGKNLRIEGTIALDMTMTNGERLPSAAGSWSRGAGPTLNLLILSVAVFAAPSARWRDRVVGLPVLVAGMFLVGAYHLTVDVQEAALKYLGYQWLATMPLAGTEGNVAYFKAMESRFQSLIWIKSFNDAGGAMFLAVVAGLAGHAPTWGWRMSMRQPPPAAAPQ